MPEVVGREHGHAGIATGPCDRHPQTIGRADREEWCGRVAILAGRQAVDENTVEVVRELDPPGTPRLRDLGSHEPGAAVLVQVADRRRCELADAGAGRVECEKADEVPRSEEPGGRFDMVGMRRLDLVGLLEAKLAALRDRLTALAIALDEAGNELADAVGAARDEWMRSYDPEIVEATAKLRASIGAAREAIDLLGRAKAGRVWLGRFEPSLARIGKVQQFHGGSAPFRVKRPQTFSEQPALGDILDLAEEAFVEIEGMVASG
jgi:hypothetical protein